MAECANRYGSEIAGVPAEGIETLISVEKLRGTDFWVGAIDAPKSGNTSVFDRKFVVQVEVSDG